MKKNDVLVKIPLESAKIEELKEANIPICHVLSKLYKE